MSSCHLILLSIAASLSWLGGTTAVAPAINCDPVEGYYLPNGEDYRGHLSITETGIPCQNWSEQHPHLHDTVVPDPLTGVGNHAYCRNPNGLGRPGCFTRDPFVRYQFCNVGRPCDFTPPKPVLMFEPQSGTQLRMGQFITITCFPSPCRVYYTLDGREANARSGKVYSRPFTLEENTTVKAMASLPSGNSLWGQAVYSVSPPLTGTDVYFTPPPTQTYHAPVLVVLKGFAENDTLLIFMNEELHGFPYGGPFWLNESTNLTAVVNEKVTVRVGYTIVATETPVDVYPPSGRYIGGVSCLVPHSDLRASYAISINESEWQSLDEPLFVLEKVGVSRLVMRVTHLGGVQSILRRLYEVVEAIPPILFPPAAPEVVYTHPIRVTCADPVGQVLAFSVNDNEEPLFSIYLDTIGRYTINCTYTDTLHRTRRTSVVYELQSAPLEMPLLTPKCDRSFPLTPLQLDAIIIPPADAQDEDGDDNGDFSRFTLNATAVNAMIEPLPGGNSFVLVAQNAPVNVTVTLKTHSSHPLEADSLSCVCTYEILPLGSSTTPSFVGRPTCTNVEECINPLLRQLALCLSFHTTELIHETMIGAFLVLKLVRLPASLQAEYYARAGDCLLRMSSLRDLRNETSGSIQLARWWQAERNPLTSDFVTGVELTLVVEGWGLESGAFHLVRHEFSCDDIGVPPTGRNVSGSSSSSIMRLTFVVDVPWSYKLCATLNDALYAVPSDDLLVVKPGPLPLLLSTPCGGSGAGQSEEYTALEADVSPRSMYSRLFFSINAGMWHQTAANSKPQIAWPTAAKTSSVLALAADHRSGASTTCVFYISQRSVPGGLKYHWRTVVSVQGGGSSNVLLAVNGTLLSENSRVEFYAYAPRRKQTSASRLTQRMVSSSSSSLTSPSLTRAADHTPGNSANTPIFASLGTAKKSFAVADCTFPLTGGADEAALSVVVVIDEVSFNAEPLTVALSPLAIAMHSCNNCTSGQCFQDVCVCIGETNRTAHICKESTSPSTHVTSGSTRLLFLIMYLILLGVVTVLLGVAITRGTARRARESESGAVVETL